MKSHYIYKKVSRPWLLTLAVLLATLTTTVQAQENVLVINDFEGGIDKTVYVPIYLNNTDTVIAAQFDIELPFAAADDAVAMLSARANRHSVSFSKIADKTYRVVLMNTANYPLRGNSGLLIRMPMKTYDDGQTTTPYPIRISNLVLTDKEGNDIATQKVVEGNYSVNRNNLPDLTVTNITPQKTQCAPGDVLTISYNVENIGSGATLSGWTEKIYLESVNGTRTYLGSQVYTTTLAAETTLNRTFTATLPHVLHIDGEAYVVVELVTAVDMGELTADQGNNTGISTSAITLSKQLYLTADANTIYEGKQWGYTVATLTRSGDWSLPETFTIDCPVSNLLTCNGLTLPCTITIPAQAAGATLRIEAVNDKIVRTREPSITVTSTTGYQSETLLLKRVDDDNNPLSLALTPSTTIAEGETVTLTATRGGELTDELTVNVSCTHATRFDKAFTLHFDAGESIASIEATVIDDDTPQLDAKVKFTASVTDYQTATTTIMLTDDDRPTLAMTLSQPSIMENIDTDTEALPMTLTISRDRGLERNATIWLTSSRKELTFENSRVTIPAGSEEIVVPVHVTDNSNVDGQRNVTLTAAYYGSYEQQTAPVGDRSTVQATLTIVDDETPHLTLSSKVSAVGEGASAEVTVYRHVSDKSGPLSVTMSSSDSRVSFSPQPVTIPAGNSSALFHINVARNSIEDDDDDILLTATATGVTDGLLRMHITDRSLPDAVSTTISCVGSPFYSGLPTTIRATIRNYGTNVLPEGMTINFYLADTSQLYSFTKSTYFFQGTTNDEVAVAGEKTFEFEAQLPQMVGYYYIYARLNPDKKIGEFDTGNNITQTFCPIHIEAPFEVATIAASPEDLLPGDVVTVQGRMSAVEGSLLNRQTVRVKLDGAGQSTSTDTQIDTEGNFKVNVKIDRSAHGYMTVKALALGQTEPAKTTRIHVYNMYLSTYNSCWEVDENIQKSGMLTLYNTSGKTVTINHFSTTQPLPDGAEITFDTSALMGATIQGGSSISIPYTVKGTVPSASWQSFTVMVKSQEGLEARLPISYFCHATSAYLVFTPSVLNTTMLYNADRDNVTVTVKNCGKKTSGKIDELITNDWVMSDFGNNRVLKPGESATIHLRLLAQPDMHVGRVYKNLLQLTPENGESAALPINVTTTGNEYSKFDLFATDVYSMGQDDYSHVADASVTVVNARTGVTMMTGTTDSEGHWTTDKMKEGLYNVTVKAPRHHTVTRQLAVGPGEDRQLTMLLPYKAFLADFVVDQDMATNTYTMKQYFDIDRQAPQAIVVAYISDDGFGCGSETMQIKLCNEGLRPASNIKLTFPTVGGYTFTQLNSMPTTMMPGDVFMAEVAFEGPDEGRSRVISAIKLQYVFDIKGEILGETDEYQTLIGCANIIDKPVPPVVVDPEWPEDPDEPNSNDPYNPYDPENPWQPGGNSGEDGENAGPSGGVALSTYKSFMAIEFDDDLSNLRCGKPFQATLRIKNGQEGSLRSLRFIPQISDEEYEDCTALFEYSEGETTGFTADGKYYKLGGDSEGTMRLTLTPMDEAAIDGPVSYYIGGLVSYIDSKAGIHNTGSLPLFTLTVVPTGEMTITYLIQKHFLADDEDTEVIEEALPTMFSLLARNTGGIAVENLQLMSQQPTVIDNASSRQVPYTAHYAALDGEEGNYTFADFAIERIEADATAAARWIYSSEKSAHVTNMESVIDDVVSQTSSVANVIIGATHELYRAVASANTAPIETTDDELTELDRTIALLTQADTYLVNDLDDEMGLPDGVVTNTGEMETLTIASPESRIIPAASIGDYTLTVKSTADGWVYGQMHDPTNGLMRLSSVTRRSDGRQIPLANFWQTDRTPQADYSMLQECLLHFADKIEGTEESYDLHFVARPKQPVQLMSIRLLTADDTEVEDGATTTEPVKKIELAFTGPLKKFAFSGIALKAHDKTLSLSNANKTGTEDKCRWTIDISSLEEIPGEHVLTVKADKQKAASGDKVMGSAEVRWTENLQGSALITIDVATEAAYGTTIPSTGLLPYGLQTLKAIPAEGYQFDGWKDGKTMLSDEEEWQFDVWKAQKLTAVFSVRQLNVKAGTNDGGQINGNPSGIYDYGSSLQFSAIPDENYSFMGWIVDGELIQTEDPTLSIVIKKDTNVKAYFARNASMQLDMDEGWNWVSNYLIEPLPVSELGETFYRVLSQTDEVINDKVYGLVGDLNCLQPGVSYKVETTTPVTITNNGHLHDVMINPLDLSTGWNWISFPYLEERPIATAITNAEEGDYITAQTGFAEYSDGQWTGTINMLQPGVGYQYKSVSDKPLLFDFSNGTNSTTRTLHYSLSKEQDGPTVNIHAYPSTMNITANIILDDFEQQPRSCTVYALCGDELRGVSQWVDGRCYLTVYGDEPDDITLMVHLNATDQCFIATEKLTFFSDVVGSQKHPYTICVCSESEDATGVWHVEDGTMSIDRVMYNLSGQFVGNLHETKTQSYDRLPKGVYIVTDSKNGKTQKIVRK